MDEIRVKPNDKIMVGTLKVVNRTANSIIVRLAPDGTLEVVDCCLEEQGR
jgi:hypothetical protein